MKINNLKLTNFRCFEQFSIKFNDKLTVLVAKNGDGKTTVLDAISKLLWSYVKSFNYYSRWGTTIYSLNINDERLSKTGNSPQERRALFTEVKGQMEDTNSHNPLFDITISRKDGVNTRRSRDFDDYVIEQKQDNGKLILPVIAYYGTARNLPSADSLLMSKSQTKREQASEHNLLTERNYFGYMDCLKGSTNYKQLKQWTEKAFAVKWQQSEAKIPGNEFIVKQLDVVVEAVNSVLADECWENINYSALYNDLTMQNPLAGVMPVSQLSDGLRSVIGLVADVAWRYAKLNAEKESFSLKNANGIVLIDEVDVFLHPAWQQKILGSLCRTFPNIQFIVTTHSPQVVSSVPKECIRIIDNGEVITPKDQTEGAESQEVLANIFGTHPTAPVDAAVELSKYSALVSQHLEDTSEGKKLFNELVAHFGQDYPPLKKVVLHKEFLARLRKERNNA